MPRSPKPSPDEGPLERLTTAVEALAGEVGIIRDILDRILDELGWALNNDKFRPPPSGQAERTEP